MLKNISPEEFDKINDIVLYIQKELPNGVSLEVTNNSIQTIDEREDKYYLKSSRESEKIAFEKFTYNIYCMFVEAYNDWLFNRILEMQLIRSNIINTLKTNYTEILRIVGTDEWDYHNLPYEIQRAIGWKRKKLIEE